MLSTQTSGGIWKCRGYSYIVAKLLRLEEHPQYTGFLTVVIIMNTQSLTPKSIEY